MTMDIPMPWPEKVWRQAPPDYEPVTYGSIYPPIKKLADGRLVIDQCGRGDGGYDIVIFSNQDHPAMETLPDDAPRSVVKFFKANMQLRMLRATEYDAGLVKQWEKACADWDRQYGSSK